MRDTHMFESGVTRRNRCVVEYEGPEKHPRHGRPYGVLRALHFTGEAEQAIAAPKGLAIPILADISIRADLHAYAAGIALVPLHPQQPAVHLAHKEAVDKKPFETIHHGRWRVIWRLCVSLACHACSHFAAKQFGLAKILGLGMIGREKITSFQITEEVVGAIIACISCFLPALSFQNTANRIPRVAALSAIRNEGKDRFPGEIGQTVQIIGHCEGRTKIICGRADAQDVIGARIGRRSILQVMNIHVMIFCTQSLCNRFCYPAGSPAL